MRKLHILAISIAAFLVHTRSQAQDSNAKTDSLSDDIASSSFSASLTYLSDNVYLGRKDSVQLPYSTPELEYHFKSGIFFRASASYLSTENRMDDYTLAGGYSFTKNNWNGEISVEKYFYSSQSYSVKSELTGDVSANAGYNFGPVESDLSGSISFGSSNDYAASLTLQHGFQVFQKNGDITPTFIANASTQNYYNAYYQKRKFIKRKKGKPVSYTASSGTLNTVKFEILDYEASIPFDYSVNKFTFTFTPTLAIPVHPNTVALTLTSSNGQQVTKTYTEQIGNSFFWSLGVSYQF